MSYTTPEGKKFPRAYVQDVKDEPCMEYTTFPVMGIGARPSGLPKNPGRILSLEHVGANAPGGKK